jgi:hypothetical protein
MLYMVEITASMERANAIDAGEGPGPFFAYIAEHFRPQALYGDPTRRHGYLIVELEGEAKIAELMYVLTWWSGTEPKFTPIMPMEVYAVGIENAKKAPDVGAILSKAAVA